MNECQSLFAAVNRASLLTNCIKSFLIFTYNSGKFDQARNAIASNGAVKRSSQKEMQAPEDEVF
jgi:hypothetical protein